MKDAHFEAKTIEPQTKDKAQKIVAALYLLTSHIDIENPLRTEIRTNATSMLKAVLSHAKIDDFKNNIISFLSVAVLTKEISPENASIIEHEIQNLRIRHVQMSEPVLSHLFMHEKEHVLVEGGEIKETTDKDSMTVLKSETERSQNMVGGSREMAQTKDMAFMQKQKQLEAGNQSIQRQPNDQNMANRKDEKKARRTRVLEHLSKTELRSIKDISKFFTDCSEKTIQRELNDLVEERAIVRVGDRRWSMYKLS